MGHSEPHHSAAASVFPCIATVLIFTIGLLVGCMPISQAPQRDLSAEAARLISFGSANSKCPSPSNCNRLPVERHENYTLFFAEFDDEGWLTSANTDTIAFGYDHHDVHAIGNRKDSIGNIKSTLRNLPDPSLIVLFIHGWKHNAGASDGNVSEFRMELQKLADAYPIRNVIGIYVGWRGTPFYSIDPLESLTYYNRKAAAENVARGSVQELIAFITAYEWSRNVEHVNPTHCTRAAQGADCADITPINVRQGPPQDLDVNPRHQPVISIFIGHSFGGLILFESLSQPLLTYVINAELQVRDRQKVEATAVGLPDLAILLNPAVEAVRFEPLYRAMRGRRDPLKYYGPRLVSITTTADEATRYAFPISRVISAPSGVDRKFEAYISTIGHAKPYITHDLVTRKSEPCPSVIGGDTPQCMGQTLLTVRGGVEFRCSNFREMWNVSTDKSVMGGHNDITEEVLLSFVNGLMAQRFSSAIQHESDCKPPTRPDNNLASERP